MIGPKKSREIPAAKNAKKNTIQSAQLWAARGVRDGPEIGPKCLLMAGMSGGAAGR